MKKILSHPKVQRQLKKFLDHPKVKTHLKPGMKFIVSGLTGFLLETLILTFLKEYYGVPPIIAKIPSSFIAITFVYFFNKYITFQNKDRSTNQKIRFIIVYSCALTLSYILYALLLYVHIHYEIAQVITVGTVAVLNYILSHGFIFRKTSEGAAE